MADSEDEEWTGRVNPLVYAARQCCTMNDKGKNVNRMLGKKGGGIKNIFSR